MPVAKATTTVYVNGRNMGHHDVTISAEIGDDMPGRMNVHSGVNQRTGTIRWVLPKPVQTEQLHPWRTKDPETGFKLPSKGDRIAVDMTLNGKTTRVFTGKVDSSKGAFTDMPVTEIIDDIDKLNRVVRLPPMRHHMPPDKDTGTEYKHVSLSPNATIAWVASMCGFHITPPDNGGRVLLSAPLQGTAMTRSDDVGRVKTSWRGSGESYDLPTFKEISAGLALSEGWVAYEPKNRALPQDTVVLSCIIGEGHDSEFILHCTVGGQQIRINIFGDKSVHANIAGVEIGRAQAAEGDFVQVAFSKNGRVVIKTPAGETSFSGPTWDGDLSDRMAMRAYAGSSIYGVQIIATNGGAFPRGSFTPNLRVRMGYPYTLWYQRSIRDEKAIDVIEEIAANLLSSVWIDGEGTLNVLYSRVGYRQGDRHSIGTRWDIREVKWEDSTLYQANDIYVNYKTTTVDWTYTSGGSYITLWESPDQQFNAGEEVVHWIGPSDSQDWLEVDTTVKHPAWSEDALTEFKRKNGTFFGFAVAVSGDPTNKKGERWGSGNFRIETVTPWRFKVTVRANEASSTHVPELAGIHPSMWGKAIPVVRGGALVEQIDAEPYKVSGGEPTAADLEHDAGKWCTTTRAQDLGEHIRATTAAAQSVLTGVEIFFNPEIKLSDIVLMHLGDIGGGVILTGYVLKISHDMKSDKTTLTLRVINQANPWTWGTVAQDFWNYTDVENTFENLNALESNRR